MHTPAIASAFATWLFLYGSQYTTIVGARGGWVIFLVGVTVSLYSQSSTTRSTLQASRHRLYIFPLPFVVIVLWLTWRLITTGWSNYTPIEALSWHTEFIALSIFLPFYSFHSIQSLDRRTKILTYVLFANIIFGTIISPILGVGQIFEGAGSAKGERWSFIHPNIAAQFPLALAILLFANPIRFNSSGATKDKTNLTNSLPSFFIALGLGYLVYLTGSRTSLLGFYMACILGMVGWIATRVGFAHQSHGRLFLSFASLLITHISLFVVATYFSYAELDEITSGRWGYSQILLDTVESPLLGEGSLPPGTSLLGTIEERGAGIDGAYIFILYSEGWFGLILLISWLATLAWASSTNPRTFMIAFISLPIVTMTALFETQPILTGSPLSLLIYFILLPETISRNKNQLA